MKASVCFQRVLVARFDSHNPDEALAVSRLAHQCGKRITGDESFASVPIAEFLMSDPQDALFVATEGMAMCDQSNKHPLRAVYIALGMYDPEDDRNAIAQIRKTGDVDFEGFIEQGFRLEADVATNGEDIVRLCDAPVETKVVSRSSGEQSELFAELSEIAILLPSLSQSDRSPEELLFESPFRWGVSTLRRLNASSLSKGTLDSALLLGEGVLFWSSVERQTDRYGFVYLSTTPTENAERVPLFVADSAGEYGLLVAEIVESRQSPHMGDTFRHIFPERPELGEIIELGNGVCRVGDDHTVGIEPEDDRAIDWMNPAALYRCHCQTVRLFFVPRGSSTP